MKNTSIGVFLLSCMISFAPAVFGQTEPVTVVVDDAYPPYTYGSSRKARGLYVELIKTAFERAGIASEIHAYPWEKALMIGADGKAAVGGAYKNEERLKIYDYSDPIYEETLAVYVRKGSAFPFNGLSDLTGRTVGINRAWSYGDDFDRARKAGVFKADEARDNQANVRRLVLGQVDCIVADEVSIAQILQRQGLEDDVQKLPKPAASNKAYVIFARTMNRKATLERFNDALRGMKRDGSYQQLVAGFFSNTRPGRPDATNN